MRRVTRTKWMTLVWLLLAQSFGFSQADQHSETLVLSGHSGYIPLTQINGRSYLALDALARLMNGSLSYRGSQTTLTLPAAGSSAGTVPPGQAAGPGFSKDFLNAVIETLS